MGFVKTRLESGVLTKFDVLKLYTGMLVDTIRSANMSKADIILLSITDVEKLPSAKLDKLDFLELLPQNEKNKLYQVLHIQPKGEFGDKMDSAVNWAFTIADNVIVLGADSPHTSPEILNSSFDLIQSKYFVIGPSVSAGIYLIGMNHNMNIKGLKDVFTTPELVRITEMAKQNNLKSKLIEYLQDIDVETDLISFMYLMKARELETAHLTGVADYYPTHTLKVIESLKLLISEGDNNRDLILKREGKYKE